MNASEALARLRRLGVPVIATADAAAAWKLATDTTSHALKGLAKAGLIASVRHGTWWIEGSDPDPYRLPEYLTLPMPSYLSLQTALHLRGLIEQIPHVFYAVTLARTQRITTRIGTYSFHHVAPEVFGGFEETKAGIKLATAEKALFDFAYLSGGRSRLFTHLPELELPRGFRRSALARWVAAIPSSRGRTLTERRLADLLARASATR